MKTLLKRILNKLEYVKDYTYDEHKYNRLHDYCKKLKNIIKRLQK
jgi:hypothetical protein